MDLPPTPWLKSLRPDLITDRARVDAGPISQVPFALIGIQTTSANPFISHFLTHVVTTGLLVADHSLLAGPETVVPYFPVMTSAGARF